MALKPANRAGRKARVLMVGPSGAGKTASSLILAKALSDKEREAGKPHKVAVLDTEDGRANDYAGHPILGGWGDYLIEEVSPPYQTTKVIDFLKEVQGDGQYGVIVADGLTPFWSGVGGLLDVKEAPGTKKGVAGWNLVGKLQRRMEGSLLKAPWHIIVTVRQKTRKTHLDADNVATTPDEISLYYRDGLEFEFPVVLTLNRDHLTTSALGKDVTGLFSQMKQAIRPEHGFRLWDWLHQSPTQPFVGTGDGTKQKSSSKQSTGSTGATVSTAEAEDSLFGNA